MVGLGRSRFLSCACAMLDDVVLHLDGCAHAILDSMIGLGRSRFLSCACACVHSDVVKLLTQYSCLWLVCVCLVHVCVVML